MMVPVLLLVSLLQASPSSLAFQQLSSIGSSRFTLAGKRSGNMRLCGRRLSRVKTLVDGDENTAVFDPMTTDEDCERLLRPGDSRTWPLTSARIAPATAGLATAAAGAQQALAAADNAVISQGSLDPSSFVPVCPTSDGFYRFLQGSTEAVVGSESFVQYGPLIAGGLLRVRLELCVIESFTYEAVVPFVKKNGLSWVLPVHETVETFLAGVIFALASTFILVGSTKILTVIVTYADFLVGVPGRVLGGFVFDRASGKPVTLDVGFGPFKRRVIGPEVKEGEEEAAVDFSKLGILQLIVVILSGALRLVGAAVGVSASGLSRRLVL